MKFKKEKKVELNNNRCKVIIMGHILEVTQCDYINKKNYITKIDKNNYIDNRTGEIKQYKISKNRRDSIEGVRETVKKIRMLINNNFTGGDDETHLVLTYKENMRDTKKLYKDMDVFIKKLRRRYKGLSYMYVIEPQKRGAWHVHALIKGVNEGFNYKELWEHGEQVFSRNLKDVDNIGAYLSAYLTNLSPEAKKGSRLYLYPSNVKIFRHSNDIKYPEVIEMSVQDVKKITNGLTACYSETVNILNDDDKVVNSIKHINYNIKREKNQETMNINNFGKIVINTNAENVVINNRDNSN